MTLCIQKLISTKYFLHHKRYLFTTINNFQSNTKHHVESSHIKYEALPNTKSTSINNFKGPGLKDFINVTRSDLSKVQNEANIIPYLQSNMRWGEQRNVFFEVYGCQMNVNDTEVVWSILKSSGFIKTDDINKADVILLITCAIREGAETKIWNRLKHLSSMKRGRSLRKSPLQVGLLGCMAERLKTQLLEREQTVDLVAGPDSYKDLPRLLAITRGGPRAANILLSLDETYADIMPVRLNEGAATAFVSIMRGCDNMCSYCIVPFTRGRERSRPVASILDEIRALAEQGVKEITLLGQNVNSYRDLSSGTSHFVESGNTDDSTRLAKGFQTVYKNKAGGVRFAELLQKVSETVPDVRIRFTSPHPKDFPDEVFQTIHDNRNICRNLHLPAQSGSTAVLERMRRGYTREAYLELASRARSLLPGLALSSDFICGFCGETEHDFKETLSLMEEVGYHVAYLFAYSMREKTTAHRRYTDDVPADVKNLRLQEMAQVYRKGAQKLMEQYLGADQLVLVEGPSKRSPTEYYGRNDANIKVIFPIDPIQSEYTPAINNQESNNTGSPTRPIQTGDFIVVKITHTNSQVMRGIPLYHTSLKCYNNTITD